MLKNPAKKQENYYLSDINSEFESGNGLDEDDANSIISSQVSQLSNLRNTIDSRIENFETKETEEERKRYFMSIAFQMKFKYTDRIKNKNIKISDIYNLAKAQDINKEDWYIFIYSQLGIE